MGLEWHGTTGPYYYRKQRVGGRVVSEYLGHGMLAELAASYAAAERFAAQQRRAAVRAQARVATERATLLRAIEDNVRTLAAGCLIVNGFYAHKRQWRRRGDAMESGTQLSPVSPVGDRLPSAAERHADGMRAFRAAMDMAPVSAPGRTPTAKQQAEAEQRKRAAVRAALDAYPEIWSTLRQELTLAELKFIEGTAAGEVIKATLRAILAGVRRDLGYETAPMLEKLIIEQIALAWFDLDLMQQRYAAITLGKHSGYDGDYWSKRLNGAHARFLRATEALARIRRLATPVPLQVNIGGQQVNVAGVVPSDG